MTTMRHDPIDPGEFTAVERPVFREGPPCVVDHMTRPVVTIGWAEPVAHASRVMQDRHIRHLLVVDSEQRLLGIVTDGDLAEALAAQGIWDASTAPPRITVGDAMTTNPVTVAPTCDLGVAITLMYEHKLSALPVVENERPVGILSEIDVLREFAHTLARKGPSAPGPAGRTRSGPRGTAPE